MQLESWGGSAVPANFEYLRMGSGSPVLQDNVQYYVSIHAKRYGGDIYSRAALWVINANAQIDLIHDTGDVKDNNWGMDRMLENLAMFDVGGADKVGNYTISITGLMARQQPAHSVVFSPLREQIRTNTGTVPIVLDGSGNGFVDVVFQMPYNKNLPFVQCTATEVGDVTTNPGVIRANNITARGFRCRVVGGAPAATINVAWRSAVTF